MLQLWPTRTSCTRFRLVFKGKKGKLACAFLAPFEFPHFFPSLFLQRLFQGGADMPVSQMSRLGRGGWRMSQFWLLFGRMPRASSVSSLSLRVNLWRHFRPKRWPRRSSTAGLMHQLMARGGWWFLRWSTRSSSRSFPFCGLLVPSFALPLLVHHR
jgi:hypothetical protein